MRLLLATRLDQGSRRRIDEPWAWSCWRHSVATPACLCVTAVRCWWFVVSLHSVAAACASTSTAVRHQLIILRFLAVIFCLPPLLLPLLLAS
jgi:hypothetical protein